MNIALIPARGGSKRIKNKNIKIFKGRPLISYAIECAFKSSLFDEIYVSTDSERIKDIALDCGAKVPSFRPPHLSDDFATTMDVICYEIENLNLKNDDIVCCIYPTAILLDAKFLKLGLQKLKENNYCFSACEFESNPFRGFLFKDNKLSMLFNDYINTRSQDLENVYFDAGQFYYGYAKTFLSRKPIFSEDSNIVLIPFSNTIDLNTPLDWERAKIKYELCMH